jgi:hypothetical protein
MNELQDRLAKLRSIADDCSQIGKTTANRVKREFYADMADQLRRIATDLEAAIAGDNMDADEAQAGP